MRVVAVVQLLLALAVAQVVLERRGGVDAPAAFAGIRLVTGSFGRPGPPLDVVVDGPSGSRRARVAGGYPDNAAVQARFGAVPPGRVRVCVRNAGAARVVLFGAPPQTAYDEVRTTDRPAALGVVFLAAEPRSMAAMVPEVVRRAARFKPAWLGAWAYWVLLVAVALGLPALLAAAASSSSRSASS